MAAPRHPRDKVKGNLCRQIEQKFSFGFGFQGLLCRSLLSFPNARRQNEAISCSTLNEQTNNGQRETVIGAERESNYEWDLSNKKRMLALNATHGMVTLCHEENWRQTSHKFNRKIIKTKQSKRNTHTRAGSTQPRHGNNRKIVKKKNQRIIKEDEEKRFCSLPE